MPDTFYPFVGEGSTDPTEMPDMVENPARIAVFDDPLSSPRVVVVQPKDVRSYLEEVTATVTKLAKEQGGKISFTVIREVVENLVHAYFSEPTITILDGGNTIRFCDQGPGIKEKERALEYGTTSATEDMKRYIRGVGSGLPYAQQYMIDHGGDLTIEDNINGGTIVTITMPSDDDWSDTGAPAPTTGVGMAAPTVGASSMAAPVSGALPPAAQGLAAPGEQAAAGAPAMPQQLAGVAPQAGAWPQGATGAYPGGWPQAQQQAPFGYAPASPQTAPATWGYAQPGYPQQASYPQQSWQQTAPHQMWPQQQGWGQQPGYGAEQAAPAAQPYGATPVGAPWQADVSLNERGRTTMAYLAQHESVGPTELYELYGSSMSTWTRELKRLEDQGLIRRMGQKRFLTEMGRTVATQVLNS